MNEILAKKQKKPHPWKMGSTKQFVFRRPCYTFRSLVDQRRRSLLQSRFALRPTWHWYIYITYLKTRFILKLTFLPCARLWRPASSSRMACETGHYPDLENVMTFESRDVRALCAWEDFGEGVSDNEECLGVRPAKS